MSLGAEATAEQPPCAGNGDITTVSKTVSAAVVVADDPDSNARSPRDTFSTTLFACFDDWDSFCEVFWCEPCQISRQYNVLMNNNERRLHYGICTVGILEPLMAQALWPNAIFPMLCDFLSIVSVYNRFQLLQRYGMSEPPLHTFFIACVCRQCATCQAYREMSVRGDWPGGWPIFVDKPFRIAEPKMV